jgi:tetratricopeptide (TPR) repeat protein
MPRFKLQRIAVVCSTITLAAVLAGSAHARGPEREIGREQELEAKRHFGVAEAALKDKDYDRAIKEYLASFDLVPLPALLFDVGKAYQLKNDSRSALEYYRRYLDLEPDGPASAQARAEIRVLEQAINAESQPRPTPTAVSEPSDRTRESPQSAPAERASRSPTWLAWALGAGGVALAAAGTVVVLSVSHSVDACSPRCSPDRVDTLKRRYYVGYALVGTGAVVTVSGVALWAFASPSAEGARGGVAVAGHF